MMPELELVESLLVTDVGAFSEMRLCPYCSPQQFAVFGRRLSNLRNGKNVFYWRQLEMQWDYRGSEEDCDHSKFYCSDVVEVVVSPPSLFCLFVKLHAPLETWKIHLVASILPISADDFFAKIVVCDCNASLEALIRFHPSVQHRAVTFNSQIWADPPNFI